MKYCGIVTPFRGVYICVCLVIGIPVSETTLEELVCCVLDHLQRDGVVNLYYGGNNLLELLQSWEKFCNSGTLMTSPASPPSHPVLSQRQ